MKYIVDASLVDKGIKRFSVEQTRKARTIITQGSVMIRDAARKRLVWRRSADGPGGRFTARLAHSIAYRLGDGGLSSEIGVGVKYGKYVEGYPTAPKRRFVPFRVAPGLKLWLIRHGVVVKDYRRADRKWYSRIFDIFRRERGGIMVGGERSVTPFMRPAAEEQLPRILKRAETELRP